MAIAAVSAAPSTPPEVRFARFAWALLGYTLFVILFGAVVRITGSGAGCGQHWPSCNGELLHLPRTLKTAIEYGHRFTSGLSVLSLVALAWGAFRVFPRGHAVRSAAVIAFAMIIVEALIGAVLVRLHLVENDASVTRAVVMPLHLLSTALLTGALAWAAYFATRGQSTNSPLPAGARLLLVAAGAAILLVSATGAITALGDTVYPVHGATLAARVAEDQGAGAHFLQRVRGIHPFLALAAAAFVAYAAALLPGYRDTREVRRGSVLVTICVALQVLAGGLNIWLSAPGFMQVLHLLLANFAWISLILLAATVRAAEPRKALG